ncbi:hypothetical protein ACX1NX_03000 [Acinetobacter sp. ANC 5383]
MNLIEQLGGYEMAKIAQGSREIGGLPVGCDLDNALLEYRREHGIYEVGDLVVYPSNKYIFKFVSEFSYKRKNILVRKAKLKNINSDRSTSTISLSILNLRHATDEEIKAGHRL